MNTLVRLATRNTLRRRARTLLTAGMVIFAVSLLLISLTWIRGMFGSMTRAAAAFNGHVRVVVPAYVSKEELMPLDEHVEGAAALAQWLAQQPGVVGVEPRIMTGVTVTVGEEIGEVFGLAVGADERYFRTRTSAKDQLGSGHWFTGDPDEVIVGAKVAEQAEAHLGDEIVLVGATQDGSLSSIKGKLIGIVQTGGLLDRQLFLPLAKVQYLTDLEDGATELLVYTDDYHDADGLAERLAARPELQAYAVQSFSSREPWRSLGKTVQTIQSIIIFIVVLLASLGIWNTMMMSVLERTHEIGVLRAMGLSGLGAVSLFVIEALAIGLVGGLLGVALGSGPAWWLESHGITLGAKTASNLPILISETIHGELSFSSVALAFGLGLLMALLGSVVPALRAARIQPVAAMRSGR